MNRSGAPTTYNRIIPDRGCGFILKRIADLTVNPKAKRPTKQDVYAGTSWANRPGFASLLWSSLIKDGLIESNGGMLEYKYYKFYKRSSVGTRAVGRGEGTGGVGYTVRYRLTDKGRKTFFEMMERVTENYMKKKLFGNSKTVAGPRPEEWREDDFLEPGETKEEWAARNGVTLTEVPPAPAEREFNAKQKLDAIINDLMDLRDSLS